MPNVSVIIPAYNAAQYIRETLDSVLAQTYRDREILVVDDGSTDDTLDVLRSYGDQIVLLRQDNEGPAAARNLAAKRAKGTWLAFVDSDDIWLPEKLERQLAECGRYAISHTNSVFVGGGVDGVVKTAITPQFGGWVCERLLLGNFITTSTVMVRKSAFHDCGGFDVSYRCVQDWPLWLSLCAKHELGYVAEPLIHYRLREGSITMNSRRTLEARTRVLREAFAPGGVGFDHEELRRPAFANTYLVAVHYAAQSGARWIPVNYAFHALCYQPANLTHWKWLLKACSVAVGFKY